MGAGGHGKVVAEAAMLTEMWDEIAFLDNNIDYSSVMDVPVVGSFNSYLEHIQDYSNAFVALGNNHLRLLWIEKLKHAGYTIPVIIHPNSILSKFCRIDYGTVVLANAVINPSVEISEGCIINTASSVDHDSKLGKGVHVSPGVNISGTVSIGAYSWLGVGAKIANNISVGANVIIAAGATVISDVPNNVMVAGVPAKIKKYVGDEH
ncbi:putative acetyltransferase EpsM [compost metagenome]